MLLFAGSCGVLRDGLGSMWSLPFMYGIINTEVIVTYLFLYYNRIMKKKEKIQIINIDSAFFMRIA